VGILAPVLVALAQSVVRCFDVPGVVAVPVGPHVGIPFPDRGGNVSRRATLRVSNRPRQTQAGNQGNAVRQDTRQLSR
jgi:hypothetical protein